MEIPQTLQRLWDFFLSSGCKRCIGGFDRWIYPPVARKKVVVAQSRRARVYKRTGDCRVPFCGKEQQRQERALTFEKSRSKRYKACSDVVEVGRIELPSESALTGTSPGAEGYCEDPKSSVSVRTGKPSSLSIR